jgi:hypothetical protein
MGRRRGIRGVADRSATFRGSQNKLMVRGSSFDGSPT